MPLHIDIRLNRELLHTLHIARLEGGTAPDDINTYVIVKGEEPLFREQWVANGTQYEHEDHGYTEHYDNSYDHDHQ